MAGYQRILSYLYHYQEGIRQECVGFIKIEKRTESLRVNVSVNDATWKADTSLSVSLYKNRGENVSLHELGNVFMPKEREEMSLILAEPKYLNFDSEQWDGIVIHDTEKVHYGSIWQGDELPVRKMSLHGSDTETMEQSGEEMISVVNEKETDKPTEESSIPQTNQNGETLKQNDTEKELEATEIKPSVHKSETWRNQYARRKIHERSHQTGKEGSGNR